MKKIGLFMIVLLCITTSSKGQLSNEEIIQLKNNLRSAEQDSNRLNIYYALAYGYRFSDIDSSLLYSDHAIKLADLLGFLFIKSQMLSLKGATVLESGKLPESLQYQFEALKIGEKINDTSTVAFALNRIGNIYMELANYKTANDYYNLSREKFQQINDIGMVHNEVSNIGNVYELMGSPDSALYFQQIVYKASLKSKNRLNYTRPEIMFRMGNAYKLNGNMEKALMFYKKGVVEANFDNDLRNLSMNKLLIAKLYFEMKLIDSSLNYALSAIETGKEISFRKLIYEASILVSEILKNKNDFKGAFTYLNLADVERDSLTGTKRFQDLQRIILAEQESQKIENAKRIAEKNKIKQLILMGGAGIFLFIAFVFYHNNRQKQRANNVLEKTLEDLKATQRQLIQSEKMASLGELTAGIAHEIQNPLNFVNNFSEVNSELIEELKSEKSKVESERDEKLEDDLLNDIAENEKKINHHGKRADAIVKGMLQHSRSSNGVKEQTDINALADEYLRLAYNGLRAKDKSFNATMKTDFDNSIGHINIIPQDIGRVILNLITNAFYAAPLPPEGGFKDPDYKHDPTVWITTKKEDNKVLISVRDNGPGILPKVLDKIFQPFFTTKPTGQGTGLGLSLSYDIVKAHGGEIKVETTQREGLSSEDSSKAGTTFIIQLPI